MNEAARSPRSALPTMQARSRATLERLLEAAEQLIREKGLEGATIEAIAARARVSVGIVYRRFPHKDGLLRAVYERFFDRREAANARALSRENWGRTQTIDLLRSVVMGAVIGAARERRVIRSLTRYAAEHRDPVFRATARRVNAATHRRLCERILDSTPPAQRARVAARVGLAVDVLILGLRGYLIADGPPSGVTPDRETFTTEMTALVARYLGIDSQGPATKARTVRRKAPRA